MLFKLLLAEDLKYSEKIIDIMNGDAKYIPSEFERVDKLNLEFVFDEKLMKERRTFFVDLPLKNED